MQISGKSRDGENFAPKNHIAANRRKLPQFSPELSRPGLPLQTNLDKELRPQPEVDLKSSSRRSEPGVQLDSNRQLLVRLESGPKSLKTNARTRV
jgi:hypothetical protein